MNDVDMLMRRALKCAAFDACKTKHGRAEDDDIVEGLALLMTMPQDEAMKAIAKAMTTGEMQYGTLTDSTIERAEVRADAYELFRRIVAGTKERAAYDSLRMFGLYFYEQHKIFENLMPWADCEENAGVQLYCYKRALECREKGQRTSDLNINDILDEILDI